MSAAEVISPDRAVINMSGPTVSSAFQSPTFGEDGSFHVKQPVGSMSISPCGRDVVLASKEGLHIIDLDSPYSPPRYLPHHTPWEVADVQWSPFAARDSWVVSTSNQKALVWNLDMKTWENSIEHVLHAHSRAITDINFSAHHLDMLATCAVDSFVHCWDLRIPARPVITFSDWFAGATQVKWNRQDAHIVASSHDKYLRIWDDRMGSYPIRSIEAHSTKINGIDWNRMRYGALVTCSLDNTIKFWDYTSEQEIPEHTIRASFPVWRARHTPFGWGMLAMPQRGNSDLHLYSRRIGEWSRPMDGLPLIHSFPGHKGQVKEFLWRPRGAIVSGIDHREFQLVSWGTDRELRLHRVDPDILCGVGYEKGKPFVPTLNITRKGAVYKTFRDEPPEEEFGDSLGPENTAPSTSPYSSHHRSRLSTGIGMNTVSMPYARAWMQGMDSRVGMQGRTNFRAETNPISWMRGVKISGWDIETLGDEITHVGEKFTKVEFESVDVKQRRATISLHGPWGAEVASLFLKIDIKFPTEYPRAAVPIYNIQKTAAVTDQLSTKISTELQTISEIYLSRRRGCLEGVLRYLLGECNLEESIAWVYGRSTEAAKFIANDLGEESSDEDEEVGQFRDQDSLGMSSELLRPVNANAMVPVAKASGATWSRDGRLVCFFPPKRDRCTVLFNSLGFKEVTRLPRNEKVFEGFGRLQTSSPGRQIATGTGLTMAATDDGMSDDSDDVSTTSSSSSSSSDIVCGLPSRFQVPQTWRNDGSLGLYRSSRSAGNSQRSTTGATARSVDSPHNVLSIHNFSSLLPAKRELATRYRIFGNGADVCGHNAAVAADAGCCHLAQVWDLLRLILLNKDVQSDNDVTPPLRRVKVNINKKDNAINSSQDHHRKRIYHKATIFNDIHSSGQSVGGLWLVPAFFDHFDRIGDMQMLAMLSCIFHEQCLRRHSLRKENRRDGEAFGQQGPPQFAVDCFSTSKSKSHSVANVTTISRDSYTTPATHSPGPLTVQSHSLSTTPHSAGSTPPIASRPMSARRPQAHSLSISGSPDHPSIIRNGSGFGTALASSLSRSFTFGRSSSSSPPASGNVKKKASPNGSTSAASSGWTASGLLGKAVSVIPDYLAVSTTLASQTHSDTGSEKRQAPKTPIRARVLLKNEGSFDNEEHCLSPFIDEKKDWLYRSYRGAYADLLFVWGLPVEQSEVLKIGSFSDRSSDVRLGHWSHRASHFSIPAPDHEAIPPSILESQTSGLDIQRHCLHCGIALNLSVFSTSAKKEPLTRGKINARVAPTCPNCKAGQALPTKLPCVICGEAVDGMFIPCLNCGHVSCFACHQQWFFHKSSNTSCDGGAPDELNTSDGNLPLCPSGCGCNCSEHEVIDVPMPPNPLRTGHRSTAF
ncbi:hypothetical protein Egran_00256 [Elaphomyces granulatus]|uniref:RING-type domain-containing protein n=1 Tax=Elaphomyces granulatus TaxID=519963 RepID=A0A232M6R3_9EURO|nr:hypothetical protein Egran_00256 [Elaphomyces granulatus]